MRGFGSVKCVECTGWNNATAVTTEIRGNGLGELL